MPLVQLGRGDVPPAPAFPPQVLQGKGHSLGWGHVRAVGRSRETEGSGCAGACLTCTLGGSAPQGQRRSVAGGRCARRVCPVSSPLSLPRAGQGEEGAAGFPQGAEGRLPHTPPASIPHAGAHALAPAACKDRLREGGRQSQGPLHPPPWLLALLLRCLMPRSLHRPGQPQ